MTQQEKIEHIKTFCTALPDNLSVGGSLVLEGTQMAGSVYGCGIKNRTIHVYNHPKKGRAVSLGCFIGTLPECEEAINKKYRRDAATEYIAKVREAFAYKQNISC